MYSVTCTFFHEINEKYVCCLLNWSVVVSLFTKINFEKRSHVIQKTLIVIDEKSYHFYHQPSVSLFSSWTNKCLSEDICSTFFDSPPRESFQKLVHCCLSLQYAMVIDKNTAQFFSIMQRQFAGNFTIPCSKYNVLMCFSLTYFHKFTI